MGCVTVAVVSANPIVVYDGECAFCRCSVRWATRRLRVDVRYVAWQEIDVASLGLTVESCREAVQWVEDAQILSGHRAVTKLLRSAQQPWRTLGAIGDVPPLRLVARGAYAVVKANRSRLVHFCRQPIE